MLPSIPGCLCDLRYDCQCIICFHRYLVNRVRLVLWEIFLNGFFFSNNLSLVHYSLTTFKYIANIPHKENTDYDNNRNKCIINIRKPNTYVCRVVFAAGFPDIESIKSNVVSVVISLRSRYRTLFRVWNIVFSNRPFETALQNLYRINVCDGATTYYGTFFFGQALNSLAVWSGSLSRLNAKPSSIHVCLKLTGCKTCIRSI